MADQVLSVEGQEQVVVPNESFINDAEMSRDGGDLVLTAPNGESFVIEGYFTSIDAPDLVSPEGGFLSADLVGAFLSPAHAGEYADAGQTLTDVSPAGQMTEVAGDVWVMRADGTRVVAGQGTLVYEGDMIETSQDGAVDMLFADNTTFAISEGARLSVDEYVYNNEAQSGTSFFSMLKGAFVYTSGVIGKNDPEDVNIETPVGSIGIRGTMVIGHINPAGQSSEITIIDGAIVVSNAAGVIELNNSFQTIQLSSYSAPATNIGVVDAGYLQNTYNFDNTLTNYSTGTYLPLAQSAVPLDTVPQNGAPQNGVPLDTAPQNGVPQSGPHGSVVPPNGPATTAADAGVLPQNLVQNGSLPPADLLVQQMIQHQFMQQVDGTGNQFVGNLGGLGNLGGSFVPPSLSGAGGGNPPPPPPPPPSFTTNIPVVNSAPTISGFNGTQDTNADGIADIRFLENTGFKVGHVFAGDPNGDALTYQIVGGNPVGVSSGTPLFNIQNNGDIFVATEDTSIVSMTYSLQVQVTDIHGASVMTAVDVQVTPLVHANTQWFPVPGDNVINANSDAQSTLVWAGAGQDSISAATSDVGDVLLGGTGSDFFGIGSLAFSFIDGGLLDGNISNTISNSVVQGVGGAVTLLGDTVSVGNSIPTIGLADAGKFHNIENFAFTSGFANSLTLNTASVIQMTDSRNELHIWNQSGAVNSTNLNLNLAGGEFVLQGVPGVTEIYRSGIDPTVTVVVHETVTNEIAVV